MDSENKKQDITKARGFNVLLAAIVTLALLGFIAGTRTSTKPVASQGKTTSIDSKAPKAIAYWELQKRQRDPNARKELATLIPDNSKIAAKAPTDAERSQALLDRTKLRAFTGAPPMAPHPICEMTTESCIVCHKSGMVIKEKTAPVMSHQMLTNCIQCHVSAVRKEPKEPSEMPPNSFAGWLSWGEGKTAWPGAPPIIPHPTWMRKDCNSCHGQFGKIGLKTPHPQRNNCKQCHLGLAGMP